jgi:hypothetical protein
MERKNLPIAVPQQAAWIRGLRINTDDPQPETGGYLQCTDHTGAFREYPISLAEMDTLLSWMREQKIEVPFQIL